LNRKGAKGAKKEFVSGLGKLNREGAKGAKKRGRNRGQKTDDMTDGGSQRRGEIMALPFEGS